MVRGKGWDLGSEPLRVKLCWAPSPPGNTERKRLGKNVEHKLRKVAVQWVDVELRKSKPRSRVLVKSFCVSLCQWFSIRLKINILKFQKIRAWEHCKFNLIYLFIFVISSKWLDYLKVSLVYVMIRMCQFLYTDTDECKHANTCLANSQCKNREGSYDCLCKTGFKKSKTGKCVGKYPTVFSFMLYFHRVVFNDSQIGWT